MSERLMQGPSKRTRAINWSMRGLSAAAVCVPLGMLAWLLIALTRSAFFAELSLGSIAAPIGSATLASVVIVLAALALALPIGVSAAIELSEYVGRWSRLLELNLACLAAVPTVVYGLVGMELFARAFGVGPVAGAATLALVSVPLIMLCTREALGAATPAEREAALALGATRGQILRSVVLPRAIPGLLGGVLSSLARAFAEAASLIVVLGALSFEPAPTGQASLEALPLTIFAWVADAGPAGDASGAAASLVLVLVCLGLGGVGLRLRRSRTIEDDEVLP